MKSSISSKARCICPPAAAISFKGTFFANAEATSNDTGATDDSRRCSLRRSRVRVWTTGYNRSSEMEAEATCANPQRQEDGLPSSLAAKVSSFEWSRLFLGHNVTTLLFVSRHHNFSCVSEVFASSLECNSNSVYNENHCSIPEKSSLLFIGTDKGMLTAADVSGGGGNTILYTTYLGDAAAAACTTGGDDSSFLIEKAAYSGPCTSTVFSLGLLPERFDAVVALVGSAEGSRVYLLSLADGSVLQENVLSKSYTIMATPCYRPIASADSSQREQVILLGFGNSQERAVGAHNISANFMRSSTSLFLFDVQKRKQWLKLAGAVSLSCSALALEERLHFAAGAFDSGDIQHESQLVLWRLPSRQTKQQQAESGLTGRAKKLHPAAVCTYFESIVQLILPLHPTGESIAEGAAVFDTVERFVGDNNVTCDKAAQYLIGLSRSSTILLWEYRVVSDETGIDRNVIDLLFQCNTSMYSLSSSLNASAAALDANPGVWFLHNESIESDFESQRLEKVSSLGRAESKKHFRSEKRIYRSQHMITLRLVRGHYFAPVFQTLHFSDDFLGPEREFYLPLLDPVNNSLQMVVKALTATAVRAAARESARKKSVYLSTESVVDDSRSSSSSSAFIKRNIGTVSVNDIDEKPSIASERSEKETKKQKAQGMMDAVATTSGVMAGQSNVSSVLRQALAVSDTRLLESVLCTTSKDKKEVAAAVGCLTASHALVLLQYLSQQQQAKPAASILKGSWIEEIIKQHGVTLGTMEAGREQLVLMLLQVEERRRAEAALVKVKGRVELLLQQMQRMQRLKDERRKQELESREPLVIYREHGGI